MADIIDLNAHPDEMLISNYDLGFEEGSIAASSTYGTLTFGLLQTLWSEDDCDYARGYLAAFNSVALRRA